MIYTKFSTEKVSKSRQNNLVEFVDISKLTEHGGDIIKDADLVQLEGKLKNNTLIENFKKNYVDTSLESTLLVEKAVSRTQPRSQLPEFIQFNPIDSLKKLPSIIIDKKDYLLGYKKDNGCRNLYTTSSETGFEIKGEVEIQNESGTNNATVWWCE